MTRGKPYIERLNAQDAPTQAKFVKLFRAILGLTLCCRSKPTPTTPGPKFRPIDISISYNTSKFKRLNPPSFNGRPDPLIVEV